MPPHCLFPSCGKHNVAVSSICNDCQKPIIVAAAACLRSGRDPLKLLTSACSPEIPELQGYDGDPAPSRSPSSRLEGPELLWSQVLGLGRNFLERLERAPRPCEAGLEVIMLLLRALLALLRLLSPSR